MQNGKSIYQSTPCPSAAKQNTLEYNLKTPTAASSAASSSSSSTAAKQASTANAPEIDRTIEFMATYQVCADAVKLFSDETADLYKVWKVRNANTIARIEKDGALQDQLQKSVASKRNGKAGMCRPIGLELRGVQN
jgi:hypothetical protein